MQTQRKTQWAALRLLLRSSGPQALPPTLSPVPRRCCAEVLTRHVVQRLLRHVVQRLLRHRISFRPSCSAVRNGELGLSHFSWPLQGPN
ncbi:hypothetical protein CB1_000700012 [Camelus ferus]|nr:hypothetical protein CB1_000700012 [Camelus ferus]